MTLECRQSNITSAYPPRISLLRRVTPKITKATETKRRRQIQYSKRISWNEYHLINREYIDATSLGGCSSACSAKELFILFRLQQRFGVRC